MYTVPWRESTLRHMDAIGGHVPVLPGGPPQGGGPMEARMARRAPAGHLEVTQGMDPDCPRADGWPLLAIR